MASIEWYAELSVGIAEIDDDHKAIIQLVEALHLARGRNPVEDTTGELLGQLLAVTKSHFQREEAEMQRIGFSGLVEHREQHRQLLREFGRLDQACREGQTAWSSKTTIFVRDWLNYHIRRSDMMMANAIHAFRADEPVA